MKRFFRSAGIFFKAFPGIVLFELLYKLILTAIGSPLLNLLLKAAMNSAGVSYLSSESIPQFLSSPLTLVIILLTLFTVAFFSFVEIAALTACFACLSERRRITVIGMLKIGLRSFGRVFHEKGILSFLGFMLIIPVVQLTLSSGVFFAPMMPMLRMALASFNRFPVIAVFTLLQLLLIFLLSSRSYCFQYLVLTGEDFHDSMKKSRSLLKGKTIRTTVEITLWSLMLALITAVVTFILSFIIVLFAKGFTKPNDALISALRILSYAGQIFLAVSSVLSAPMIICFLTSKFIHDTENTEKITIPDSEKSGISTPVKVIAVIVIGGVSVFLNFSYLEGLYKGNIDFNVGMLSAPQLTAHRGYSHIAPENSIYAFEEAMNIGSDYIELDVQQSKDGQLVVIHDSSLDRTTDGEGKVSDFTYAELSALSCGKWFGNGEFSDARIMLLSEVLDLTRDEILLNIEIKKTGNPADTARKTVELLAEYEMTDSCYITSFSYQALKAVKKAEPSVKTGLITNIATTAVYSQLRDIDAVSLNHIFVNKNIVSTAHKNGKKVFVWTVNDESDIERMISMGVDNIITDRPDVAAETIYSYGMGDFVLTFLENVFGT